MTATLPAPPALAYDLAVGRCTFWLQQAGRLWLAHPIFFLAVAGAVVMLRRGLDALGMDHFIVVSYLTDAWIFTWLALGASRAGAGDARSLARTGWQGLKGRWLAVLKTALWGVPAALASFIIFLLVPKGVQVLVVLQGHALLAAAVLFIALGVGGFISMVLGLLPVLAAIQMARDPHATLMSSGLWAFRGLRAGIRPLALLFVLFVSATVVCNTATTWVMGHLPLSVFGDKSTDDIVEVLLMAPLTVFVMMNGFLALLPALAGDLLRSADVDLSDEIFTNAQKGAHGDAFWVRVLEFAGQSLRLIALLSVVFLGIYAAFSGYDEAAEWLVYAVVAFVWGGSFRKSARGWRENLSWSLRYRFLITPVWLMAVLVGIAALDDAIPETPPAE